LLNLLQIDSHRDGMSNFLPAPALPELSAPLIIVVYHNDNAFHSGATQAIEAFVQKTLTESASLIGRINCQMINMSATSVVPAQRDSNNCRSINRDPAEPWVAFEKLSDAFPIITFRDFETFDPIPEEKYRVVIADAKFSGSDFIAHVEFASFDLDHAASC